MAEPEHVHELMLHDSRNAHFRRTVEPNAPLEDIPASVPGDERNSRGGNSPVDADVDGINSPANRCVIPREKETTA